MSLGLWFLAGPIPWSAIKKLTKLKKLVLQRDFKATNNFEPGDFPDLSCCPDLEELEISGCRITGEILPSLCKLVQLERVSLSYNRLEGILPKDLGNLIKLKKFTATCNPMMATKVPESIDKLLYIQVFDISHRNWSELTGAPPTVMQERWNLDVEPWNVGTVVDKTPAVVEEEVTVEEEVKEEDDEDFDEAFA